MNLNNKKIFILGILIVFITTITIVYAALSTTLNIIGNAEVVASSWNVYFDNIKVNSGSVSAVKVPSVVEGKTIDFSVELNKPGDFYKFTVDVVNDGSIDAMIESVVKSPDLTSEQAKFIKYEIEYTDGNLINSRQLLSSGETKTISVLIAYRNDLSVSDLSSSNVTLNLSFTMVYTQADELSVTIPEKVSTVRLVNGDLNITGSEIAIGNEHFYLIKNNGSTITLLSKYNLLVGNKFIYSSKTLTPIENPTGIQDENARGYLSTTDIHYGGVVFSDSVYWTNMISLEPLYIYNSNSALYTHVENYKTYLVNMGVVINEARLINKEELISLGCDFSLNRCSGYYNWVYLTSFWTGVAHDDFSVWGVGSTNHFGNHKIEDGSDLGVRPVIEISLSYF